MTEKNKSNRRWVYYLIFIVCVLVVVVLIILFLTQGRTTISGSEDIDSTESITCEGKNIPYPFFSYDNAKNKSVKINILVNKSKKLDTISLVYSYGYETKEEAETSRVENHASLNKAFYESGLKADSFDTRFANLGDAMQLTLYAEARQINGMSAKYFLINGSHDLTRDTLTKNYNNQGLDCVINNKS